MDKKLVLGSLTLGAIMMAGLIGIISLLQENSEQDGSEVFDEINDMPIGI